MLSKVIINIHFFEFIRNVFQVRLDRLIQMHISMDFLRQNELFFMILL
jgi:hypothetical protein